MTGKRFKPNYDGRLIIDTMTGDEYEFHSGAEEPVIELLNRIYEEVEIGKEYCKVLETDLGNCADARIRLQRENESLKDEIKFLKNKVATYKTGNALLKATLDKERGYDG